MAGYNIACFARSIALSGDLDPCICTVEKMSPGHGNPNISLDRNGIIVTGLRVRVTWVIMFPWPLRGMVS